MTNNLTAVLLFTGAGGMDIGFENAGVQVVFANELMPEAVATYNANHAEGIMVNDDINNVMDRLDQFQGVDLVFGGPPCQRGSVAAKMDPDDDRNKLIFTFLDVVERVKPRAFVMEKVKALGKLEKWESVRKKYLERVQKLEEFPWRIIRFSLKRWYDGRYVRLIGILCSKTGGRSGWHYI